MKKTYLSFIAFLTFFENAISAFGLMFATFFTVVQIVNRYWLHFEIMWLSDLVLYVFVMGSIFSIALTTRLDAHSCVDVFMEMLCRGEKAKKLARIAIGAVSLGILCMLLPLFYAYFLRALKFAEWGTLVPWFNTSWLVEAIFIMFLLNIFHISHNIAVNAIALYGLYGGGAEKCPSA